MPRYDHLQLLRLPERLERRKHGGGGPPPPRNATTHGGKLRAELDNAIETQQRRRKPQFIDPSLILRVRMAGALLETDWEALGLTVVSNDADRTLVLFTSSDEMRDFRIRLNAYQAGARTNLGNPPYNGFIANIDSIGAVEPRDRIGIRFRERGLLELEDFDPYAAFLVDIEFWDLGGREIRDRRLTQVAAYIDSLGGSVFDEYVGQYLTMARANISGTILRTLLTIEDIASIDDPPVPDLLNRDAYNLVIDNLPPLADASDNLPLIGIIDSGVNDHPLLEDILIGAIGVPESLGTADVFGHGTRVGGIAVFGDLRAQLETDTLTRGARLCSAKVINDSGGFDDRTLVPSQMRQAITTLHERFGCRIFVIALGDRTKPYDGGKVGSWAATLDSLARELDVVVIVSSGNRQPRKGDVLEEAVTGYPDYLLEPENRFFEPAGAMNVVSVGSIAHGEGFDDRFTREARVRPITKEREPSPFSRVGPGIGGATKPDLVDVGGTIIFDPTVGRLRGGEDLPSAGILSLHHLFLDRLFTAASGTSYAAPRVAFSAAQILSKFPEASANLIRALLIGSAEIPAQTIDCMSLLDGEALRAVSGHGVIDLERAAFSDDARVVLYAEDELPIDYFGIYQLPIPEPFQTEPGKRSIRITLAYDPPVRHTRTDYVGVGMSFRLVRGCNSDMIFDHYRRRTTQDGPFPDLAARYNCILSPGPQDRERGTVQCATATFKRNVEAYGNNYYLVVRCESGWAASLTTQRFAVVVEISHSAEVKLYERIRQRIRV